MTVHEGFGVMFEGGVGVGSREETKDISRIEPLRHERVGVGSEVGRETKDMSRIEPLGYLARHERVGVGSEVGREETKDISSIGYEGRARPELPAHDPERSCALGFRV